MTGQTISHYEVLEKLGEGGMGVVYRARDTHLDRFVALKILPPEKMADPERKRRFIQEAKAASALNHPNIVTIHDFCHEDGVDFMVMEYIPGKTLDQVIPRKGMPPGEALKCAVQVSDALAAAHAAGIVHRDLKPRNVMVTEQGRVKVLDFGLAKLTEAPTPDPTASTQIVEPQTEEGAIVGTVAYMSPEQAEGKAVDARSDIFSFGALLYEMVTGKRAFQGDTSASTLAAILKDEPRSLPAETPHDLEQVIKRCLRKDPARRFQHMDDVRIALEELKEDSDSGRLAAGTAAERKRFRRWPTIAAVAVVLLSVVLLVWRLREASLPSDLRPVVLTSYPGFEHVPSFSPDGNKVAFAWNGEKEDNYDIYVKQIGSLGPPMRLTTSPSLEYFPAWSPDDRWVAYARGEQGNTEIMLISPLGGPERKLTQTLSLGALSWTPNAEWLVFSDLDPSSRRSGIWAIHIGSGERRRLTAMGSEAQGYGGIVLGDYRPSVSPDGRALVFGRRMNGWVWGIYVLPLTEELRPAGESVRATDTNYDGFNGVAWTADGREIIYSAGGPAMWKLWRLPVSGRQTPTLLSYVFPAASSPAVARTSPRLVYTWLLNTVNIWRLDTRTRERKRLTGSTHYSQFPQYSPDGRKIAFQSTRSGDWRAWTCDADGSNCQQLSEGGAPHWSPDGRWLALDFRAGGPTQISVIAADGGPMRRLTDSLAFDNSRPSWSQSGEWIYFTSDRSGRNEVWKVPSGGGQAVQVTRSGGGMALESPDGRYVYYIKEPGPPGLFRMPVEGGEEKQVLPGNIVWRNFGVTAKGIYYVPDGKTIQFLDTATGKVTALATVDRLGDGGICPSPDDAYVVFGQSEGRTVDLMLVEGFR
ncbi:MAG: protein kinase [Bryobacteraceae bacterium]